MLARPRPCGRRRRRSSARAPVGQRVLRLRAGLRYGREAGDLAAGRGRDRAARGAAALPAAVDAPLWDASTSVARSVCRRSAATRSCASAPRLIDSRRRVRETSSVSAYEGVEHVDSHRARRLAAAPDEAAGGLRRLRRGEDQLGATCKAEQDAAAEDSIRRLEEVGEPIVTDGEQRESSFATYPITDTLAGTGLADNLAGDGQYFAIFDDGHHRQLPRLTGGPFRYKTFAVRVRREEQGDRHAPGQAGGHRAVDADAAAPARGRDPRLLARAVPERPLRRVRAGHPPVLRRRRRARLDRLHRGPAREQERLAQPVDRHGHAAGLHRPQQPRDRPLQRRGAQEHRRPHLPRRRLRLRALHGRAVREAAEQDVPAQRGLLPDPVLERGPTARTSTGSAASTAARTPTAWRRSASWA